MSKVSLYVAETVIAFTLLVIGAYLLKRRGVLKQEEGPVFARLLTQAVLPVTIFYSLWTNPLSGSNFAPVLVMFLTGVAALFVSWLAGYLLKFDRPSTGALMIVSSFGSSALMGYPIIQYAFPDSTRALAEGIVISEVGVGLPIFILCPAVAMFFGGTAQAGRNIGALAKEYLRSPICLAVVLGLACSQLRLPAGMPIVDTIREALKMAQGATVFVSAIILGLQLTFRRPTGFWLLIAVSIAVQMLFQPWFSDVVANGMAVGAEDRQILVLISSMPAAILGPVFAARYDCAAKTATLLTFTHIVVSPMLVPAIFALLA